MQRLPAQPNVDHPVCPSGRVSGFIAAAVIGAIDETFNSICDNVTQKYVLNYLGLCKRLHTFLPITNQLCRQLFVIIYKINFWQIAQFLHNGERDLPTIE
jgi:hypothetical protein